MSFAVPLIGGAIGQSFASNIAWSLASEYALSTAMFDTILGAGFAAGAALAGAFIAPGLPNVEGPKAAQNLGQVSTYGKFIPIPYGRTRLAGNIIWSNGIREVKSTESVGGKGGGGQTVTTYTYYCTWALALCEGKVRDIHKIWFDFDLIYDAETGATRIPDFQNKVTFYYGDEDQEADPIMQAANGQANTPPYKGICYLVFDDIDLTDFGNRLPNITVELSRFPDVGITSEIYPIEMDESAYQSAASYISGLFRETPKTTEAVDIASIITTGQLRQPLVTYSMLPEAVDVSSTMTTGLIRTLLLTNTMAAEAVDIASTMTTGQIRTLLITTEMLPEAVNVASTIIGGSLS
jgi:hypothetical protein